MKFTHTIKIELTWRHILGSAIAGTGMIWPLHIVAPDVWVEIWKFWEAVAVMIGFMSVGEAIKKSED